MRIAWISTYERICGIADYSKVLWPEIESQLNKKGYQSKLLSLDNYPRVSELWMELDRFKPDIIHFQHEYGIYGGKNPPFYWFPKLVRKIRKKLAATKIIATAHTVLDSDYRFPDGKGIFDRTVREMANQFLLKPLQRRWGPLTWGALDGVIVHSSFQALSLAKSGVQRVKVIPHFVSLENSSPPGSMARSTTTALQKNILVFGFFTPEKGQDIVIRAMEHIKAPSVRLVLAGGLRRREDQVYLMECQDLIKKSKFKDQIQITGYVEPSRIDGYFNQATLVVVPFRKTSGSGSLAQALSRGMPILASNLRLNAEILDREPGAMAMFESENPIDLASKIEDLLGDPDALSKLKVNARKYAQKCSPKTIAFETLDFYEELTKGSQ